MHLRGHGDERVRSTTTKSEAKLERRERRIRRRRLEILGVAKVAFLRKPYSEVTVEEIAGNADLSKATIYLYFRNKAEIYGGVLEEDMQALVNVLEAAYRPECGIRENLVSFGAEYVRYFRSHSEYFSTLSFFFFPRREAPLPPNIARRIEKRLAAAMGVVERSIRQAIRQGEIAERSAWQVGAALWSMWLGATYLALTDRTEKFSSRLEQLVKIGTMDFLDGLLIAKTGASRPRARISNSRALG
jgi:AcrR family transcriptional regulator